MPEKKKNVGGRLTNKMATEIIRRYYDAGERNYKKIAKATGSSEGMVSRLMNRWIKQDTETRQEVFREHLVQFTRCEEDDKGFSESKEALHKLRQQLEAELDQVGDMAKAMQDVVKRLREHPDFDAQSFSEIKSAISALANAQLVYLRMI